MLFYLNENSFFIEGKSKGAIYNMNTCNMYWLDESEAILLVKCEKHLPIQDKNLDFFKKLEELELGFLTPRKTFIDKNREFNSCIARRKEIVKPGIRTAYFKLNDVCQRNCSICNEVFCPLCYCHNDPNTLSVDHWMDFLDKLIKGGLTKIILTGGDVLSFDSLELLVNKALQHHINVTLVWNGHKKIPESLLKGIHIILVNNSSKLEDDLLKALDQLKTYNHYTVICSNKYVHNQLKDIYNESSKVFFINPKPCIKDIDSLLGFNASTFFIRQEYDSCLYSKLYVDHKGNILPCFENNNQPLANICYDSLSYILDLLIDNFWFNPLPPEKCQQCELYYQCSTCRYRDSETSCKYNINLGCFVSEELV